MLATIAGAAAALGGAIIGGIKSAKANNQARRLLQQQRDENRRWYDTKMNQDYTQRADVQNAITKQRELLDEQLKRANARSVVGGASPESAALEKEAANKSVADATADIAAAGASYKDQVEQQYRSNDAALNQQQIQNYQTQAAQTAQAASQVVNAGLGMIGTDSVNPTSTSASTSSKAIPRNTDYTTLGGGGTVAKPASILSQEEMDAARKKVQQTNA